MELTISSKQLANMGIPDLPLEAFGGMRPLPRAMVNAGITYHKGGAAKWIAPVVAVAAAIVIPYAAPAVFSALASSVGVAAATMSTTAFTIGSAVVGAGMGALAGVASAAISGQNMGRSALFGAVGGAIGGGIGGYAEAGKIAATTAQTAEATAGTAGAVEAAAPSVVPAEAVQITEDGIAYSKLTGEMLTETPQGFVAASQAGQTGGIGAQLSNTTGAGTSLETGGAMATGAEGTTQAAPTAGLSTTSAPAEVTGSGLTTGTANVTTGGVQAAGGAGAGAGAGTGAGAAAPTSFGEALKQVPSAIAQKFSDPKALADMTLRAAGQLAGSQMAGSGLSPEEQQLLNAQRAELEQLRSTNQQLFNERLQAAQNLIGEAKYFDPEYFGLQSQRRIQTAAGLQTQEALRKISPQRAGLRAAEERRARLGTTLAGETAYLQGADTAEQNRLRTTQAGINAMPTTAPAGSLQYGSYMGNLYDIGYNRRAKEAAGIGSFIGGLTGTNKSGSLFS